MFALSTKGRYATRAMVELASRHDSPPAQLAELSASQDISAKYLSHLMSALVSAGLVDSRRGKNGGFILAKAPEQIRVYDILRAVEGPAETAPCTGRPERCRRSEQCVTRSVWQKVEDSLTSVLEGISLSDLVRKQRILTAGEGKSDDSI